MVVNIKRVMTGVWRFTNFKLKFYEIQLILMFLIGKIAVNMLNDDEPLDKIIRFTGLSQDDIMGLKNKL